LKKVRKGRCHGRASQTDSSFTSSSTWERLPLETIIAAPQYAEENGLHVDAIAEDIDTNDVVCGDHTDAVQPSGNSVEPCIITDAFVQVFMTRMEAMMQEQFHRNG